MPTSNDLGPLTASMEDYLEAIYHLEQEMRIARVRDIANRLGVKMSSVTAALKGLGARGLIQYDPHQYITLTDEGIQKAKEIVRKHEVLKRFLCRVLQVSEPAAEDNACRIEHHLAPEVIDKLVKFVEFIELCPLDQTRWLDSRSKGCENCMPCLDEAKKKVIGRAEAQRAAIEGGMTLAEATPGAQVMIDSLKFGAQWPKSLDKSELNVGAVVELEKKDTQLGNLVINVKGYHVTLTLPEASTIFVKPM